MSLDLTPELCAALIHPDVVERFRQLVKPAFAECIREARAETLADSWLNSEQAAQLLGYPSLAAFKQAGYRNPELATLGTKHGRRWRFRRSDLEAYMATHPRSPRKSAT
jgi:hypothetical protein